MATKIKHSHFFSEITLENDRNIRAYISTDGESVVLARNEDEEIWLSLDQAKTIAEGILLLLKELPR